MWAVQTGRAGRLLLLGLANLTLPNLGKAAETQRFIQESGKALQSAESMFRKPRWNPCCEP